ARGALMERLGLSSAEAASQLAELSAATGIPPAEMGAGVLSDSGEAGVAGPGTAPARAAAGSAGSAVAAQVRRDGRPRSRWLMTEAAAEMAADGTELVAMLAAQLAPLGAVTVTLWLLQADRALALLESSRWQHIPSQFDCPAQRVAHGAADLWWPAGRPAGDHAPVTSTPAGARAVLALRQRNGELLGVLEASWPGPLAAFATEVRQPLP